jgi:hypothetical protein
MHCVCSSQQQRQAEGTERDLQACSRRAQGVLKGYSRGTIARETQRKAMWQVCQSLLAQSRCRCGRGELRVARLRELQRQGRRRALRIDEPRAPHVLAVAGSRRALNGNRPPCSLLQRTAAPSAAVGRFRHTASRAPAEPSQSRRRCGSQGVSPVPAQTWRRHTARSLRRTLPSAASAAARPRRTGPTAPAVAHRSQRP